MIPRHATTQLKGVGSRFPSVTVIGPRQSGKTTLVKHCFPHKDYVNLEHPQVRQFALDDPVGFLKQYEKSGAIFDEIQRAPDLISYLQPLLDEREERGLFILTGSHQFQLLEQVTQSLAGRTFLFRLLPLSTGELLDADILPDSLDQLLVQGLYPRIYSPNTLASEIHQAYFDTYLQKDVRQITNVKDLSLFQKFMTLCAGRVGQILNKESLSSDLGVNVKTIEDWLSVLEASFVVTRLPPFWMNTRKRLVKSPKLYFCDPGLVSWLLGIHKPKDLATHPAKGHLFENLVMMEALKTNFNGGKPSNIFFYRDSRKNEIDLVFELGEKAFPVEIKAASTYIPDFAKGLDQIDESKRLGKAVIFGGDHNQDRSDVQVVSWRQMSAFFKNVNDIPPGTVL
tara:strand:+ start:178 stop:1368 length:1191 start_codon:yes stop_codon:yes gene_type:complete